MKLSIALLLLGTTALASPAWAHGGQYRGAGDVASPGGGSTGGAPSGTPGGTTRGPGSDGTTRPVGPRGPVAGPSATPPSTSALSRADDSRWTQWWEFNKDPYLDLKTSLYAPRPAGADAVDALALLGGTLGTGRIRVPPTPEDVDERIVPALLAALEGETNNDLVTGCLVALAKIGDRGARRGTASLAEVFAARLADPVQEVRETAAVALGILADEPSIGTLAELLQDTERGRRLVSSSQVSYRTRAFAAYGLGLIGYRAQDAEARRRVVGLLAGTLAEDRTPTKDVGVACVISLGLVAIPNFMPDALPPDGELAPESSRRGQLDHLLRLFRDPRLDPLVRAHVPTALVRLLDGLPPEVVRHYENEISGVLIEVAESRASEEPLRESALQALGSLGDAEGRAADARIREYLLRAAKEQPDPQSRGFALVALGTLGARAGVGAGPSVRAIETFLAAELEGARSTLRPWAALGLGVLGRGLSGAAEGTPAAATRGACVQALRGALAQEKSPSRVGALAIGLGILGDLESRDLLRARLEDTADDEARGHLIVALGLVGDGVSVGRIRAVVDRSAHRPDLLRQCAVALGLLGDEDLVPELVRMLEDARGLYAQASIASALGAIGDRRSIVPLLAMLADEDKTDRARSFAAVALGIVADKEPLPWNSKIAFGLNYRAATATLDDDAGAGILNIL